MRLDWRGTPWLGAMMVLLVLLAGVSWGEEGSESRQTSADEQLACRETSPRPVQPGQEATGGDEREGTPRPGAAGPAPPGTAGMRVFLDPQTGRVIAPDQLPPEALSALEQAMLRRDTGGLIQRSLPSGAVVVDLQGRFHNFAVATIEPEGGVSTTRCLTSGEAARSLLEAGAKRSPREQASHEE